MTIKQKNKLVKEYILLLRSGLTYKEINDMIFIDYLIFKSKEREIFDNSFRNNSNIDEEPNSVIKSHDEAYSNLESLTKAYKYVNRNKNTNLN